MMQIFGLKLEKIPVPLRTMIVNAVILTTVILAAAAGLSSYVLPNFSKIRSEIETLKTRNKNLQAKNQFLKDISQDFTVDASLEKLVNAVPAENPVFLAISQIKNLVSANGIELVGLRTEAGKTESTLPTQELTVETQGIVVGTQNFLKDLTVSSPLVAVSKVNVEVAGGDLGKSTFLLSYSWSDYPKLLSNIEEPLVDLTQIERESLEELAGLTQPPYTLGDLESTNTPRENPFAP